jgi:hypothetical protein
METFYYDIFFRMITNNNISSCKSELQFFTETTTVILLRSDEAGRFNFSAKQEIHSKIA